MGGNKKADPCEPAFLKSVEDYFLNLRQKATKPNPNAPRLNDPGSGTVTRKAWMPWLELIP
jgi:hypothetical protein